MLELSQQLQNELKSIQSDIKQHRRAIVALQGYMVTLIEEEAHVDLATEHWELDLEKGTLYAHTEPAESRPA